MGRKEQLITEIRVGLNVLGKTVPEINETTKGYGRKKVAELESIWQDVHKQLKAAGKLKGQLWGPSTDVGLSAPWEPPAGKLRGQNPVPTLPRVPTIDDAIKICEEQIDGRQDTYAELWTTVKGVLERAKAELGAR